MITIQTLAVAAPLFALLVVGVAGWLEYRSIERAKIRELGGWAAMPAQATGGRSWFTVARLSWTAGVVAAPICILILVFFLVSGAKSPGGTLEKWRPSPPATIN